MGTGANACAWSSAIQAWSEATVINADFLLSVATYACDLSRGISVRSSNGKLYRGENRSIGHEEYHSAECFTDLVIL